MDRREYCRQLTQELRHLTPNEIAVVRQELWDHMEDHAEVLREAGYDEAEANERAVEAMGDPVETGREIDKQYPPIWLWLNRLAKVVIVVVCISSISGMFGGIHAVFDIIRIRNNPYYDREIPIEERIDYRIEIGNDIMHLIAIEGYVPGEDCTATLHYIIYDKKAFSPIDQNLDHKFIVCTKSSEQATFAGGSWNNGYIKQGSREIDLTAEDTYITLAYDRFGNHEECTIDLTEVGK